MQTPDPAGNLTQAGPADRFYVDFDGVGRFDHKIAPEGIFWRKAGQDSFVGPHPLDMTPLGDAFWLGFQKTGHAPGAFSSLFVDPIDGSVLTHGFSVTGRGARLRANADIVRGALDRPFNQADAARFRLAQSVGSTEVQLLPAEGPAWTLTLLDDAKGHLAIPQTAGRPCPVELFVLNDHRRPPARFIMASAGGAKAVAVILHDDGAQLNGWALLAEKSAGGTLQMQATRLSGQLS